MRFGANTTNSFLDSASWKAAWQNFVKDWRARALMSQAKTLTRQGEQLKALAEQSIYEADVLKKRAYDCMRRAQQLAPWLFGRK